MTRVFAFLREGVREENRRLPELTIVQRQKRRAGRQGWIERKKEGETAQKRTTIAPRKGVVSCKVKLRGNSHFGYFGGTTGTGPGNGAWERDLGQSAGHVHIIVQESAVGSNLKRSRQKHNTRSGPANCNKQQFRFALLLVSIDSVMDDCASHTALTCPCYLVFPEYGARMSIWSRTTTELQRSVGYVMLLVLYFQRHQTLTLQPIIAGK